MFCCRYMLSEDGLPRPRLPPPLFCTLYSVSWSRQPTLRGSGLPVKEKDSYQGKCACMCVCVFSLPCSVCVCGLACGNYSNGWTSGRGGYCAGLNMGKLSPAARNHSSPFIPFLYHLMRGVWLVCDQGFDQNQTLPMLPSSFA